MAPMIPRNSPKSPFSGFADSPKFPEPPYRGAGVFGGNFRGHECSLQTSQKPGCRTTRHPSFHHDQPHQAARQRVLHGLLPYG